jgi:thiamine kinase-like enzyme
VDRKNALKPYLIKYGAEKDYSLNNLRKGCILIGIDYSKFVFYYTDLSPRNIIVKDTPKTSTIGVIDWELAGYFLRG